MLAYKAFIKTQATTRNEHSKKHSEKAVDMASDYTEAINFYHPILFKANDR